MDYISVKIVVVVALMECLHEDLDVVCGACFGVAVGCYGCLFFYSSAERVVFECDRAFVGFVGQFGLYEAVFRIPGVCPVFVAVVCGMCEAGAAIPKSAGTIRA